jgi:hypothetical protein
MTQNRRMTQNMTAAAPAMPTTWIECRCRCLPPA